MNRAGKEDSAVVDRAGQGILGTLYSNLLLTDSFATNQMTDVPLHYLRVSKQPLLRRGGVFAVQLQNLHFLLVANSVAKI